MSSFAGCLVSPGVTKYFLGCYRWGYKDLTLFLVFNNYFNTYTYHFQRKNFNGLSWFLWLYILKAELKPYYCTVKKGFLNYLIRYHFECTQLLSAAIF